MNDTFEQSIDIKCVCLDFKSSDLTIADQFTDEIQSFDDECLCISHLLSSEEKLIYFVASVAAGELVIPQIHNHRYIRYIYIYQSPDSKLDTKWTDDFDKVRGIWPSTDEINEQIKYDIQSCKTSPSPWTQDPSLLVELWTQSSKKSSLNIVPLPKQTVSDSIAVLNVVVLYYNDYRPFRLYHGCIKIHQFDDVERCRNFIVECDSQSPIFLIICIDSLDSYKAIYRRMKLDSVHAIYIFSNHSSTREFQAILPDIRMKLSGIFSNFNDILLQLCNDICLYRERLFYIPRITVLRSDVNRIQKLDEHEVDFIRFQLFIETLPQAPHLINSSAKINTNLSDDIFSELLIDPNFGQIVNILFQRCSLLTLLEASSLLNGINQRLNSLVSKRNIFPAAIYRAQVINREHLDILQSNINNWLTIHTFTLFSSSFSSTINICRRCMNRGLPVILLEIAVSRSSKVAQIGSNTFTCRLGSVFRILSIDKMPDGIWHVQLELIDNAMNYIKQQLLSEINVRNAWLTFGNYMFALKRFDEAEMYYKYLLSNTSPNDSIRTYIYNSMGLIYSAMNKEDEALKFFEESLGTFSKDVSINADEHDLYPVKPQSVPDLEFHPVILYGKIAEGCDRQAKYDKAFYYYRKALEFAPDPATEVFYQAMIKGTLDKIPKK